MLKRHPASTVLYSALVNIHRTLYLRKGPSRHSAMTSRHPGRPMDIQSLTPKLTKERTSLSALLQHEKALLGLELRISGTKCTSDCRHADPEDRHEW